jgi:FlaA1/EpsC-like NDP-sugar epimerase
MSRSPRSNSRRLLIAAGCVPLFALIHYAAYWLRFEGQLGPREQLQFSTTVAWVVLAKFLIFRSFGVFQGWGRFVTFHDLVVLVQTATTGSLLIAFGDYLLFPSVAVPRSVFLMDWGATIFIIGGLRSIVRLVDERSFGPFLVEGQQPVFIVGANDSGESLLRAIRRNLKLHHRVVGFISDDPATRGLYIDGVPVIGTLEETCQLAHKYGVFEVLMTSGELTGRQVRQLVEDGREHEIVVKVLPSYEQLIREQVNLLPREVSIEDLLRRDPVKLNIDELREWVDGRVLLVTGSAGSIGSEICRQLLQFSPKKLVIVDQSETGQFFLERELRDLAPGVEIAVCIADVADGMRMHSVFGTHQPDIVFHAAAYKHVPLMESNPGEAVKNITIASQLLADLSHQHGVKSFVMISTDKAVNPTSVMGTCKRAAELYVQALAAKSSCRYVTVRFGNVLDSAGSVVQIFRHQIASGGPITVTHPDMIRFFMTIPEASQLVIQAGAMGQGGEIFVLDMGEPVGIVELAEDMIRLSGLKVEDDIAIKFTGKRPGEKLFEELRVDGEQNVATSHAKIMVATSVAGSLKSIRVDIRELAALANSPRFEIIAKLREIVPQYQGDPPEEKTRYPAAA